MKIDLDYNINNMETSVNNKCKAFTSLKQSKKLAEFLPLESADMCWTPFDEKWDAYLGAPHPDAIKKEIPCWSLAALLDIIPKRIKDFNVLRIDIGEKDFAIWYDEIGYGVNTELPDITLESPTDACVEMIIKLNEQKLL